MTEQEALLVLNAVPELGAIRIRKLVSHFLEVLWKCCRHRLMN